MCLLSYWNIAGIGNHGAEWHYPGKSLDREASSFAGYFWTRPWSIVLLCQPLLKTDVENRLPYILWMFESYLWCIYKSPIDFESFMQKSHVCYFLSTTVGRIINFGRICAYSFQEIFVWKAEIVFPMCQYFIASCYFKHESSQDLYL